MVVLGAEVFGAEFTGLIAGAIGAVAGTFVELGGRGHAVGTVGGLAQDAEALHERGDVRAMEIGDRVGVGRNVGQRRI